MRLQKSIKRALDILVAGVVLVFSSPLMGLIALSVRVTMGSPFLFRQLRLGLGGEPFELLKFRTMTNEKDESGAYLQDEDRLTTLGRLLRASSLDELPELVNVLKGEMSIVGPRPLLVEYRELYSQDQWRRHDVPPGMAGPVMAKGRNALTWREKFDWDVWYVDNWSLWLDMKLFCQSVVKAVTGHGVSPEGRVTMEEFIGNGVDGRENE